MPSAGITPKVRGKKKVISEIVKPIIPLLLFISSFKAMIKQSFWRPCQQPQILLEALSSLIHLLGIYHLPTTLRQASSPELLNYHSKDYLFWLGLCSILLPSLLPIAEDTANSSSPTPQGQLANIFPYQPAVIFSLSSKNWFWMSCCHWNAAALSNCLPYQSSGASLACSPGLAKGPQQRSSCDPSHSLPVATSK